MITRSLPLILLLMLTATPSFSGPSSQHSARAIDHSGQAASHGSAAASTGLATVAAVPILTFGSVVAVSGAALEQVGTGAQKLGEDLLPPQASHRQEPPKLRPNDPPVLR